MHFKFKPGDDAYHTLWERNVKITRCHYIQDISESYIAYDLIFPRAEGEFRALDENHEKWLEAKRDYVPE